MQPLLSTFRNEDFGCVGSIGWAYQCVRRVQGVLSAKELLIHLEIIRLGVGEW